MIRPSPELPPARTAALTRPLICAAAACLVLGGAGCGSSPAPQVSPPPATTTQTTSTTLPGTGKPPVTIGDKNYTEQFVLGELYYLALQGQGYSVSLNRNIGPIEVTVQALQSGQLGLYPEYLDTWNSSVAGYHRIFRTRRSAYRAAQGYAFGHGLRLLDPSPFSDIQAIGVTVSYAQQNRLRAIGDLRRVAAQLALGVPPQFEQAAQGLPALEQVYGFTPATVKALEIGAQYDALDAGSVQAADVNTTDGELTSTNYAVLADPKRLFGVGNVVPVVTAQVLSSEGPAFAATVNRVTSLLTLSTMRELNAEVDQAGQDPAVVAKRFLVDHGVLSPPTTS